MPAIYVAEVQVIFKPSVAAYSNADTAPIHCWKALVSVRVRLLILSTKLKACSASTAHISLNYNGLDAVFQRMRKMQKIATPLSRLAMTIKWDSSGVYLIPRKR
jgi:hypothetical protein